MKRDAVRACLRWKCRFGMQQVKLSLSLSFSLPSFNSITQFTHMLRSHHFSFLECQKKKRCLRCSENHSNRKQVANERTSHCYLSLKKKKRKTLIAVWYKWRHLRSEAVNKNNHTRNWAQKRVTRERKTYSLWKAHDNYAYDKLFYNIKRYFFSNHKGNVSVESAQYLWTIIITHFYSLLTVFFSYEKRRRRSGRNIFNHKIKQEELYRQK